MAKSGLIEFLCDHIFTQEETAEEGKIVNILENEGFIDPDDRMILAGCPIIRKDTPDGAAYLSSAEEGICSIAAVKHDNDDSFDYYVIITGAYSGFEIFDFQENILDKLKNYVEREWGERGRYIPRDFFLYYLMRDYGLFDNDQRDNCEYVSYTLYRGYCMRTTRADEYRAYKLEPIYDYGEKTDMEVLNADILHDNNFVFAKVTCPSCKHFWVLDESGFSNGEHYEAVCKKCGTLSKRVCEKA